MWLAKKKKKKKYLEDLVQRRGPTCSNYPGLSVGLSGLPSSGAKPLFLACLQFNPHFSCQRWLVRWASSRTDHRTQLSQQDRRPAVPSLYRHREVRVGLGGTWQHLQTCRAGQGEGGGGESQTRLAKFSPGLSINLSLATDQFLIVSVLGFSSVENEDDNNGADLMAVVKTSAIIKVQGGVVLAVTATCSSVACRNNP